MYSEEDLEKYTKQLNVEKEVLLNQIKSLSEELSAKKAIIVKCFQLFENYTNILIKVNTICKCNAINNQLSVICVNNERKCVFDNNCQEIDGLITDSENVIQKFETNNNEMNDKHLFSYYSKELKAKQTTNDGKPDLMSSDDSEDSNTCIESDLDPESDENDMYFGSESFENVIKDEIIVGIQVKDENFCDENYDESSLITDNQFIEQTINSVKTNNNNEFNESVELLDKLPDNEICMKAIELKKLDLTENKGKDYVDEILQTQDLLKCQQKYSQINDKSEKPLIIGNFKKKSQEEKYSIRRKLLKNEHLIRKYAENLISLSVPQILSNKSKPILSEVLIGYECPYIGCDFKHLYKQSLIDHINAIHFKLKAFKCEICAKCFAYRKKLLRHKKVVHCNKKLDCDVNGCEFVAKQRRGLAKHQLLVHSIISGPKVPFCHWPECGAKFRDNSALKRHINAVHKHIKEFHCLWPGCEAKFNTNSYLSQHSRVHTGEQPFACDWPECEQKFKYKSALNRHKHIHEGFKPHSCSWNGCKARFLAKSHLKKHIKCHEKGGTMKCLCCVNSKRINLINDKYQEILECKDTENTTQIDDKSEKHLELEKIIKIHTQELKPIIGSVLTGFRCPYDGCDYESPRKYRVNIHINAKHLELKPYKCQNCDKRFASPEKLTQHKYIVHSNEQIKCDFNGCKFVAKHRRSLINHQNYIHSNTIRPKPHACHWPECEARFRAHSLLKKHIDSVHKNIKQFHCLWPGCDAKFSQNNGLNRHTVKFHSQ